MPDPTCGECGSPMTRRPPVDPDRPISRDALADVDEAEERAVAALTGYLEWAAGRLGAPFAGNPAAPARLLVTALVDAAEARMSDAIIAVAAEIIADRPAEPTAEYL